MRIGRQIPNNNGIVYTVLAIDGDKALLHGGNDFVVIYDLECFEKIGSWGGGKYFTCFNETESYASLASALFYFKHHRYPTDEEIGLETQED